MLRARSPADTVFFIDFHTSFTFLFWEELEAVVVDEDVGGSSLHFVGSDRSVDAADGGDDHSVQTFFVDGHLDGEVRETADAVAVDALGWLCDVVSGCGMRYGA